MAIKGFKDIVERRGYKVESEDRQIFEREIGKSYFGLGNADMIEFILYDVNNNQLPQGDDGKMVRYISLDDSNIQEYFLISSNNFTKKLNGASEFIVDIEKLVKEAGYSNGIFKTQVTLLNRRAGSEPSDRDKLWIHEISPSRTEIRVLPLKNEKLPNPDLEKRYDLFVNERQFRDDTIYYAKIYIQNITTKKVLDAFSRIKGTQKDTETYHSLIRKEFKIESIELFIQQIREKFIESMENFIDDKEWNILDLNYGKPKNELDVIELSINTIHQIFEQSLGLIIQYYLPKRTIQEENELTPEQQVTFDKVKQILKSSVSDNLYESTEPDKIDAVVRGCMDPDALNFNPKAKEDDGTCKYKQKDDEVLEIKGCTDSSALNFNPKATQDDGSCKYKDKVSQKTQTYYVWSQVASLKYKQNGEIKNLQGIEYDSFTITYDDGTYRAKGDVRTVPKLREIKPVLTSYKITNTTKNSVRREPRPKTYLYPGDEYRGIGYGDRDRYGYDYDRLDYIDDICAQINSLSLPAGLKSQNIGSCNAVISTPPPKPVVNNTPTSGGGGGGGYNFDSRGVEFNDQDDYINPYTNPGDRVDRQLIIRNYK